MLEAPALGFGVSSSVGWKEKEGWSKGNTKTNKNNTIDKTKRRDGLAAKIY